MTPDSHLSLSVARTAGTTRASVKLAIGLAAIGPITAATLVWLRLALSTFRVALDSRFTVGLRPV